MKKYSLSIILSMLLLVIAPLTGHAEEITILKPDAQPVIVNGTTLVPIRALAEWMGIPIEFDQKAQAVQVGKFDKYEDKQASNDRAAVAYLGYPLVLYINKMNVEVLGKTYFLEVPPVIWEGRTMLPLRFFAETFGVKVSWNGDTQEITFDNKGKKAKLVVPKQSDETTKTLQNKVDPIIKAHNFRKEASNGPKYSDLTKSATKYLNKPTYFYGQIFQAIEAEDGSTLLLLDVGSGNGDKLVAVLSSKSMDDLHDGDKVTVYGVVTTPYTYTTKLGYENTVPAIGVVQYFREKTVLEKALER